MNASADAASARVSGLRRELSAFSVLLLTLSCLSPIASIYVTGSDVLEHTGTGAAVLFPAALVATVVWGLVYAEIATAYPYAGGDYVAVGTILGPWAGFASLTVWMVTALPLTAVTTKFNALYLTQAIPGLPLAPTTCAVWAGSVILALPRVRTSALITGVFLAIEMAAVLALTATGLWHPARDLAAIVHDPLVSDATGNLRRVATGAMALGAIGAVYAVIGGNQAITFGEELVDPHRKMGMVILVAAAIGGLCTAIPIVCVVVGARDLPALLHSPAPFSTYFSTQLGVLAGRVMSACVALAIFNSLIASNMFYARMAFSMGRDGVLPRRASSWIGALSAASGVPRNATLAIGAGAGACCFLSTHAMVIFGAGLTTFTLGLVSCAVLVGRLKGLTGKPGHWRSPLFPLVPVMGLGLTLVFLLAGLQDREVGRPSVLLLAGCVGVAMIWYGRVLRPRGWRPRLEEP
ncbi:MAG TPA: APC family permease [Steroidobacteraceae bacterium]|nr:APC family permease [Steroidobacteraceae bacterium]